MEKKSIMSYPGAGRTIHEAVSSWPGVTWRPHRFGGTEYRLGRRELGHVHGDHMVDIPFPRKTRDELVAAGRAQRHHVLPESGWVSLHMREEADLMRALDLLRLSFERAGARSEPSGEEESGEENT